MKAKHILGIVCAILFLALIGAGIWGNNLKGEKQDLLSQKEKLELTIGDLNTLKEGLETEVDSLQMAYMSLAEENETLHGSLADVQKKLARSRATVKSVKSANANNEAEVASLQAQIQALMTAKTELEGSISALQMENDSLRQRAGILEADLGTAREENAALTSLNNSIQEEVERLTLANFKASAFQIELEKKRGNKATAKSRKAKRVKVSFDLTNVPEEYQGVRPLYLVISDDKATPIKLENPIKAQIKVNGQPTDIIAAESKEVNITADQRLTFTHELADKLSTGYYRVALYTDIGLLGANSFRLR